MTAHASAQTRLDPVRTDSAQSITAIPDSVKSLKSNFRAFIAPAALITYGALSFVVPPIRQVDHRIHNEMTQHYAGFRSTIDNYLQFAPTASVYMLNLAGVRGKNSLVDQTILIVLSEAIFYGTTAFLKSATGRIRPDDSNRLSWPSGHAGNAFTSAEFMAQEYSGRSVWYGVVAYSFATTTAVLRIYNDKHWFSDIIAGAGFGIIATKTAYYIYPAIRKKIFRIDSDKRNALLLPTYRNGALGLLFTARF
ncbi:phosphatase PAP2 family protein [Mucilaginibacter hurinus]|nr:phosphatase PAP2 family protein [Mucilaginibacter hurinus]